MATLRRPDAYKQSINPRNQIPRSTFNRSHSLKTTFDVGNIYPIMCEEILPGDLVNLNLSMVGRLTSQVVPIMDNLRISTHFFFVPNRLVWDNWEKFMGERGNPDDSIDYLIPTLNFNSTMSAVDLLLENSIYDYFGLPIKSRDLTFSSLPFRAHNLVYNEWFRHQDLQDIKRVNTGDDGDDLDDFKIYKITKNFDYFTMALRSPQKGAESTFENGEINILPDGVFKFTDNSRGHNFKSVGVRKETKSTSATHGSIQMPDISTNSSGTGWNPLYYARGLKASFGLGAGLSISTLREAFAKQRFFEKDARGGTRYPEILYNHFGVASDDARLQRPEYLGGSSDYMYTNPVAQTNNSNDGGAQADLAATGTFNANSRGFKKGFAEHGYIIGYAYIAGDQTYQQGLERHWSRSTRLDYAFPSFAHLGEQAILSKEIYADGGSHDDDVFGYVPRYEEYRHGMSKITGKMRSDADNTLHNWHLAQKFSRRPTLSSAFIESNVPIERVLAVIDEPHVRADFFFKMLHTRPLPLYGIPDDRIV